MVSQRLRRVDDQVVARRPRRSAPRASRPAAPAARRARRPSPSAVGGRPVRYSQPRPTGGAIVRIDVEGAALSSAPIAVKRGHRAAPAAGWSRCRRGRRSTCSRAPASRSAVTWSTAAPAPQPLGPVDEQRGLLGDRHVERVDVVRRDPGDVGVHRLGGDLDGRAGHLGGDPADRDRGLGDPHGLVGGEHDAGREAPGTAVDHPDGEADVLGVASAVWSTPSRTREVLVADPLEAEVGVVGPELLGPGQGHVAERRGRGGR